MEINNTDVENLSAWIASQNDELERLRAFAREAMNASDNGILVEVFHILIRKYGVFGVASLKADA